MKHDERIEVFSQEIWNWFARHKRSLPWRDLDIADDTQRAYLVLVSEIMLQQTQVPRVIIKFKEFTKAFPSISSLANATNAEVIIAWRGMGYNSRALRLRDAAKTISTEYNGVFPSELHQLLAVKGIGSYTAAAVRNFAFNMPTPCIDTNIRRILHRTFFGPENSDGTWKRSDRELLLLAKEVLNVALSASLTTEYSIRNTQNWHAALMDFGSLVQTKRNPKWNICPLSQKGIMLANQDNFPKLIKKLDQKKEPGREMGGKYIPNRIFRGKVVEALRNTKSGLTLESIGKEVCIDWDSTKHTKWLEGVITDLMKDDIIAQKHERHVLKDV